MIKKKIDENRLHIFIALAYHFAFIVMAAVLMRKECESLVYAVLVAQFLYLVYWIVSARKSFMPWIVYSTFCVGAGVEFVLNITEIIEPDEGFLSGIGQALYLLIIVAYVILLGIANLIMMAIHRIVLFRRVEDGRIETFTGKVLPTPVGNFRIYVNNSSVEFIATANRMHGVPAETIGAVAGDNDEGDGIIRPDGLYRAVIDITDLHKGDVIVGRIVNAKMKADGGDEYTMNMIGSNDVYTYGLGTVDDSSEMNENASGSIYPFHLNGLWDDGFELVMVADPVEYAAGEQELQNERRQPCQPTTLFFDIAWKTGTDDRAWDVISYVTC